MQGVLVDDHHPLGRFEDEVGVVDLQRDPRRQRRHRRTAVRRAGYGFRFGRRAGGVSPPGVLPPSAAARGGLTPPARFRPVAATSHEARRFVPQLPARRAEQACRSRTSGSGFRSHTGANVGGGRSCGIGSGCSGTFNCGTRFARMSRVFTADRTSEYDHARCSRNRTSALVGWTFTSICLRRHGEVTGTRPRTGRSSGGRGRLPARRGRRSGRGTTGR